VLRRPHDAGRPKVGLGLIRRLVAEAERREAVMMVTVCPMCQINIDAYQGEMNAMFHTHHKMRSCSSPS